MKRKIQEGEILQCDDIDENDIKHAIITIVQKRGPSKTCCPSEIPRLFFKLRNWRSKMDMTRSVAYEMAREGKISILQKGREIAIEDISTISGPIRLRLRGMLKYASCLLWYIQGNYLYLLSEL